MKHSTHCWILLCSIVLSSCAEWAKFFDTDSIDYTVYCGWQQESAATKNIQVTWQANPDAEVNRDTGGYHLYYSTDANFTPVVPTKDFNDADPNIDSVTINQDCAVPSANDAYSFTKADGKSYKLPTGVYVALPKGKTYYFKVVAFSQYNVSAASDPVTIVVD
jgi:hypothetical protein